MTKYLLVLFTLALMTLGGCGKKSKEETSICESACTLEQCSQSSIAHECYSKCQKATGESCMKIYAENHVQIPHKLNTSNQGKLAEFQRLFKQFDHDITNTTDDLDEVDSTPVTVIVQKASAVNDGKGGVLVEDTSLDIEGEDVGVNIRWLLSNLEKFEGKKATWTVLLAFRENDVVFVSEGIIEGKIVTQKGEEGFGFDPYFLPQGTDKTLAQDKPDNVNARALAVSNMMHKSFAYIEPAIDSWDGPWQEGDH